MNIKELYKHSIACVGLGTEHAAMIDYLYSRGFKGEITILETKSRDELLQRFPKLKKYTKLHWAKDTRSFSKLKEFSLLFKSPGAYFEAKLRKQLHRANVLILSPMQLFVELCPSNNIIGVTGTKGKGTTSSLIAHILKQAKKRVWLGGNIGLAPFVFIAKIKKTDWVVLELSSFQLEDMNAALKIAVFTNFTPEHLKPADPNNPNHHPNLAHYWNSKLQIARAQNKNHVLIVNEKLRKQIKKEKLTGRSIYFTASSLASTLPGEHNKENIAAAVLVAEQIKISKKIIAKAIKNFKGLEYRIEKVASYKGVEYYNDSFSTIPEAAEIAIKAFTQPIILLAGGADKGSDFTRLAKLIVKRVKFLVLLKGKATPRLKKNVLAAGFSSKNIAEVTSMKKAVAISQRQAQSGDVIILSPACASFGLFKNYKDRGKQFKQAVLRH